MLKYTLIFTAIFLNIYAYENEYSQKSFCSEFYSNSFNGLLQTQKTKAQMKAACALDPSSKPSFLGMGRACYYRIPAPWSHKVNYSALEKTGFVLRTASPESECPLLTYQDFKEATFSGAVFIENQVWRSHQMNRFRRIFSSNGTAPPPLNALTALHQWRLGEFSFQGLKIKMILPPSKPSRN